ncbi:hypothetical protein GSI_15283 [Ganoderma sinense ZZ0214-1]|uniref:Uncharacterized protein n=1 Tax=Ganoderma sinense ZZ0214-1 TaxID=1077348 RepID=A0A2G8RM51_9APHY|nr:hypothetical protein GSI_15283 [Ganoderma sinense ZZ0214-1]
MPSFATSTVVHDNSDTVHFELHTRYICVVGTPSDVVYAAKDSRPSGLDVVLLSDLVISLAGTLNGIRHEGRDIQTSVISQHLLGYFHANSENLGVRPSSEIFLDQEDGAAKLSPTPNMSDASAVANPFSPTPFLPLVAGLDRLTERLVVDLVKQYPLIFGPWRERFDAEVAVFSKLSRAVADIIHRSPHTAFRKKSRRIIKAFHKSEVSANSASASSLHIFSADMAAQRLSPANDMEDVHLGVFDTVEYCSALSRALERVYKTTSKSLRYKGLHSVSLGGGPGETADCEFVLWECLDDCPMAQNVHENMLLGIGLDARVPAELWLDEDAETVGGSQTDSDLLYDDNSSLVNNIDIRVSDKAGFLPYTPLEDSDDMWGSSQSTTLDD